MAFVLFSAVVRADGEEEALIERGNSMRREHRDAEALEQFRRAYEVRRSPRVRAQIAFAEQALGRWVDAERDLLAVMASTDDRWVASHGDVLRVASDVVRKHLATLAIRTSAPGAELWLEETRVGELPLEAIRVPAGAVRFELRAHGFESAARTVTVEPGTSVVEEIEMVPIAALGPAGAGPSPQEVASGHPAENLGAPPPPSATRRTLAWGALGMAGAFLSEAVVAQVITEVNTSRYNDNARCLIGTLSRDERCGVYRGQADTAQKLAFVGYIGAGTLAVASAILFATSRSQPARPVMTLWFGPELSGAQIGCAARF
jgi:hypothetical protein